MADNPTFAVLSELATLPRLLADLRADHNALKTHCETLQADNERLGQLVVALAAGSNTTTCDANIIAKPRTSDGGIATSSTKTTPSTETTSNAPLDAPQVSVSEELNALREELAEMRLRCEEDRVENAQLKTKLKRQQKMEKDLATLRKQTAGLLQWCENHQGEQMMVETLGKNLDLLRQKQDKLEQVSMEDVAQIAELKTKMKQLKTLGKNLKQQHQKSIDELQESQTKLQQESVTDAVEMADLKTNFGEHHAALIDDMDQLRHELRRLQQRVQELQAAETTPPVANTRRYPKYRRPE